MKKIQTKWIETLYYLLNKLNPIKIFYLVTFILYLMLNQRVPKGVVYLWVVGFELVQVAMIVCLIISYFKKSKAFLYIAVIDYIFCNFAWIYIEIENGFLGLIRQNLFFTFLSFIFQTILLLALFYFWKNADQTEENND